MRLFVLPALVFRAVLHAQSPELPQPVPLSSEPSHHLVFENQYVRVFDVEVTPHASTLLHQHDVDYLYAVLGAADVINAVLGKPKVRLQLGDGEVHFSRGRFAHVARNEGDTDFRNVTIELLRPQGPARNLCGRVLPKDPGACPEPQGLAQTDEARSEARLKVLRKDTPTAPVQPSSTQPRR